MKEKDPFPQILAYLNFLKSNFDIEVSEYENTSQINQNFMKEAIQDFIVKHQIKAIITGTRSTDPYAQNLGLSQWSDVQLGWPSFERVLPIYFWDYSMVWRFIEEAELPYCDLYNHGYTYVGDQVNSIQNPFIKGLHANKANDNIELFSRSKLFQSLPRKHGKLLFSEKNIFLIVVHPKDGPVNHKNLEFGKIQETISSFCESRGLIFEGIVADLPKTDVPDQCQSHRELFTAAVLNLKRAAGNFNVLYLGVVVSLVNNKIEVFI
jgi:hypothetical protein